MSTIQELLLPHAGWLRHEPGDDVAYFLRQGWFEAAEQAFVWLYLRSGDTVLDCGAHIGLFSVVGARAIGPNGRLVAVEPSTATAELLRQNLALNGFAHAQVVEAAVGRTSGEAFLHAGGDGRSAYNAIESSAQPGDVPVRVIALPDLLRDHGLARCDFMKLDVEGAEYDVCDGAPADRSIIPVMMIEFTEPNLARAGHSTEALYRLLEARGYTMCRFDTAARRLVPAEVTFPIWYDNLFAVSDLSAVNERLATASAEQVRIVDDILRRAEQCEPLREIEEFRRQQDEMRRHQEQLKAHIAQLDNDLQQANATAQQAWTQVKNAEKIVADERATSAQWLKLAESERARANTEQRRADLAQQNVNQLTQQLEEAEIRLQAFVTSKLETATWAVRLRRKPEWVDAFIARRMQRPGNG